jgi:ADP-ribosyl-[dinitrogen reductase] hydrolase
MLGALVGDAAGATLEFCYREINEQMAIKAMAMPGGGNIRVGPGQITDDGELTLALWSALNSFDSSQTIPIITIMKAYKDWYGSHPFDIGRTCSLAFEVYYDFFRNKNVHTLQSCKEIIKNINEYSEANGALMRATAIATWIVQNPINNIMMGVECAKEDARLSHPNIVCQDVNAIYVFAIINLLQGKTPKETLELTNEFIYDNIISDRVKQWYYEESLDISIIDITKQIGHVRWGFVLAIYFLRHPEINFEEAIKITLMKGGDTDTNAAIVGGIVGTYHKIPDYMLKPVLEFDCTSDIGCHHKRPAKYSVKKVIGHLIES